MAGKTQWTILRSVSYLFGTFDFQLSISDNFQVFGVSIVLCPVMLLNKPCYNDAYVCYGVYCIKSIVFYNMLVKTTFHFYISMGIDMHLKLKG